MVEWRSINSEQMHATWWLMQTIVKQIFAAKNGGFTCFNQKPSIVSTKIACKLNLGVLQKWGFKKQAHEFNSQNHGKPQGE
jgi:hypothetical protein